MTDNEAYQVFVDNYTEPVHNAMKQHCDKIKTDVQKRPESDKKQKIVAMINKKATLFPSKTWFMRQKPPETILTTAQGTVEIVSQAEPIMTQ